MLWRRMWESTFSWPRHYLEVSGQSQVLAALSLWKKPPVPTGSEFGWTPEPVWTIWKSENSWPYRDSNSDPSIVHPIASRYTDCATAAPKVHRTRAKFLTLHTTFSHRHDVRIYRNMIHGFPEERPPTALQGGPQANSTRNISISLQLFCTNKQLVKLLLVEFTAIGTRQILIAPLYYRRNADNGTETSDAGRQVGKVVMSRNLSISYIEPERRVSCAGHWHQATRVETANQDRYIYVKWKC
jgi:hypothetical protein